MIWQALELLAKAWRLECYRLPVRRMVNPDLRMQWQDAEALRVANGKAL